MKVINFKMSSVQQFYKKHLICVLSFITAFLFLNNTFFVVVLVNNNNTVVNICNLIQCYYLAPGPVVQAVHTVLLQKISIDASKCCKCYFAVCYIISFLYVGLSTSPSENVPR